MRSEKISNADKAVFCRSASKRYRVIGFYVRGWSSVLPAASKGAEMNRAVLDAVTLFG